MPPLRERRGEIAHLTGFFMDRYARRYNRPPRELSPELSQLFQSYEWPGNIRELENMIKRIVILQDEQLVVREMSRARRARPSRTPRAGVGVPRRASATDEPEDASSKARTTSRRSLKSRWPWRPSDRGSPTWRSRRR